jgi:diguanylate cyclase (GGDEF)-like protein
MALELADLAAKRQDDLDRLARMHRQFAQAERIAGIGSWRLDIASEAIDWSDHVYAIHDLPLTETPPFSQALSFYPGRARRALSDAVALAIEQGRPFDEEIDFVSARGTPKRVRCMGEVEMRNGEAVALIGVLQDVSRQYEMEQALRRTADTDELTGLANRAGFNRAFTTHLATAASTAKPLTLLLIDLDGFKAVNDRCGHLRGDQVLQTIAAVLHAPYLAACIGARLGGDEFGILVPGVGDDGVDALVDRLIGDLQHQIEVGDGTMLPVSGTIGISRFEPGLVERDLLRRADVALYHGKRGGRGVAIRYAPEFDPELSPAEAPAAHPRASR